MSQATTADAAATLQSDTHVRLLHIRDERRHATVDYQFLLSSGRIRAVRRSISDARGERVLDAPETTADVPAGVRRELATAVGVDWPTLASEWGDPA